jgi:monoamine oxidase
MRSWKVGIIGGGPGGLMTAYFLQKTANCPVQMTLFEASDRLGGKVLTPRFKTFPASYEAGAAEFYDYSSVDEDPLKELMAELGLSITPLGGSAVIMDQRILSNLDDFRDQFGDEACEALLTFDRAAKDWMNPREYYLDDGNSRLSGQAGPSFDAVLERIPSRKARRYLDCLIHSDLATEPQHTSASYGLQNYLMNDPRYMKLYGIEGGNERFTQELAGRISATKLLNHAVIGIGRGNNDKLIVTSNHQGVSGENSFDFVVVALPNNFLPSIQFRGARLSAAMQAHQAHYDHPAHYLRITILFDRPFWRSQLNDSFFMLDQFGGCCLYDETSREPGGTHGVLGWLLGGNAALEMSRWDDAALIESALQSLPSQFADGRRFFIEGKVHRWVNAVNAIPGGLTPRSLDLRHQPEPVDHSDLFVVGDYLFDSTINGVLDSAEYVANWLAARMTEN